ncbi:MAG: chemotaxis protein CheW [Hyphomicrobiales bacterium]
MTSKVRGNAAAIDEAAEEYITVRIADQLFGLPILGVQDVFMPESVANVPLAPPEVAGVLNLRGRIVTAIDMRRRLGLPPSQTKKARMAVGIEHNGESYGLVIDEVGEVQRLSPDTFEANPVNLDPRWAGVSAGIHRLDGSLMVVLDVKKVLALSVKEAA